MKFIFELFILFNGSEDNMFEPAVAVTANVESTIAPTKTTSKWSKEQIKEIYDLPFMELLFQAQVVHRKHFPKGGVQLSVIKNIKTGGCPENCSYCSQSIYSESGIVAEKMMDVDEIVADAKRVKDLGTTRYCMGTAWREIKDRDLDKITEIISKVKALGLETCVTLGMATLEQCQAMKEAGLDNYNHNIDTSPEHYPNIISTRTFEDRIRTIENVRAAGIKVCSGGILGLGEEAQDRISMLHVLANMDPHPDSVPINSLIVISGTQIVKEEAHNPVDWSDIVRTVATARILMPNTAVRISAGRRDMSEELQTLCFFAGANSIHWGGEYLTTESPSVEADLNLFKKLKLNTW